MLNYYELKGKKWIELDSELQYQLLLSGYNIVDGVTGNTVYNPQDGESYILDFDYFSVEARMEVFLDGSYEPIFTDDSVLY